MKWEKEIASKAPLVNGRPISRYWLIPQGERPKIFSPHPTLTAEEIRVRTQDVWDKFYSLPRDLGALARGQVASQPRWPSCSSRSSIARCTPTPASRPTAPAGPIDALGADAREPPGAVRRAADAGTADSRLLDRRRPPAELEVGRGRFDKRRAAAQHRTRGRRRAATAPRGASFTEVRYGADASAGVPRVGGAGAGVADAGPGAARGDGRGLEGLRRGRGQHAATPRSTRSTATP